MKKIVIIPAFNESKVIIDTINDIRAKAPDFDFVVVNDHSKDDTHRLLAREGIPALNLPVNLGIGGAVQTGYLYAYRNGYDIAVQLDGDGQHDPAFLHDMVTFMQKNESDMVIGSRYITKEGFQSTSLRRTGIRFFSWLIRLITGKRITDPTSGYRMINRRIMKIFAKDYPRDFPEPESVVTVLKNGFRVDELQVIMRGRQSGKSSINLIKSPYYMIKVTFAIILEGVCKHAD